MHPAVDQLADVISLTARLMVQERFNIAVDPSTTVSCIRLDAPHADSLLVYAPGAGSNVEDPFGAFLGEHLPPHGISLVRFQFPYMEHGSRSPDRPAVLRETWARVIDTVRIPGLQMVVGGRSMGGRIASVVVADGAVVDGLALFAYPLHPPGLPHQLRVAHLSGITVPTFFCSGTRDAYGSPDELRQAVANVPQATLHLLDRADHGFNVLRSSGRTREDIWQDAVRAFVEWSARRSPNTLTM